MYKGGLAFPDPPSYIPDNVQAVRVKREALTLRRIAERVKRGGHDIPGAVARRRYRKGLINLFHHYMPLFVQNQDDISPGDTSWGGGGK